MVLMAVGLEASNKVGRPHLARCLVLKEDSFVFSAESDIGDCEDGSDLDRYYITGREYPWVREITNL